MSPMISTTYNITPSTKFASRTKYALKKAFKIVKNHTKIVKNRKKSFKIISKSFAIPSFFSSTNKPLNPCLFWSTVQSAAFTHYARGGQARPYSRQSGQDWGRGGVFACHRRSDGTRRTTELGIHRTHGKGKGGKGAWMPYACSLCISQ